MLRDSITAQPGQFYIDFHRLSSTFIDFHRFSSTFIDFHQLSWNFHQLACADSIAGVPLNRPIKQGGCLESASRVLLVAPLAAGAEMLLGKTKKNGSNC